MKAIESGRDQTNFVKELSASSEQRTASTVQVRRLSKRFASTWANKDVSFDVGAGITGLLGPNGAGKTTLLRMLATLLRPTSGSVQVGQWNAEDPRDQIEIRRRLGYLPQEVGFYPSFTVAQFVDYIAALKGIRDRSQRSTAVASALAAVDLTDVAARKIRTLSGGMRRRVGVGQALVADPDLILLDEPTTGLDPQQRAHFRELIAGLGESRCVLLSTHLTEDVAMLCGHVLVLAQGAVVFDGTPVDLRAAASGLVWKTPNAPLVATATWRTDDGWYRVVGDKPDASAIPADPCLEDGYLVVAGAGVSTPR